LIYGSIYLLGSRQCDIPGLRELLEDNLPNNTFLKDFEVEHDSPSIGHKYMLLNACHSTLKWEGREMILLAREE
jgi:hypothetical protein